MRSKMLTVTALLAGLALTSVGQTGPKGGKGKGGGDTTSPETPVCAAFRDAPGDTVASDIPGTPYCGGENGIEAFIGHLGRFKLSTGKSAVRNATVNFPGCDRLIAPTGADCATDVVLNSINEWEDTGVGLMPNGTEANLLAMLDGETILADFLIAFPSTISKSTPHLLVFGGSNMGANACGTPLPVTRVDASTWTIEATTETACLFEVVAKNGRRTYTDDFAVPFAITVALR